MVQVWSMDKSRVVVLGVAQHLINFSAIVEKKQFIISNLGCVTLNSPYLQRDSWPDLFSCLNIESRIITRSAHEAFYLLHKNVIKN